MDKGADVVAGGDKTHGHGATFADLDRNFHTDLLINPGGFALCDTLLVNSWSHSGYKCEARGEVGVCDSREMPVAFMRSSGRRDPDAQIIFEGATKRPPRNDNFGAEQCRLWW